MCLVKVYLTRGPGFAGSPEGFADEVERKLERRAGEQEVSTAVSLSGVAAPRQCVGNNSMR